MEKWKRKAEKKEWKERAKLRSKKRMEMDARQEKLQQNIWFRKVENWLENKLLSFNQNKQVLANMMKEDREEIERAEIERVIHEIDPKKIDENNARLTRKKEEKAKEERVVIDIFDTLNTTKEKYPKKRDIMTALSKSEELKRKCKLTKGLSPLFNVQFVNAFMLQPAQSSGRISQKEFSAFAVAVANVGHTYIRAKQKTEEVQERKKKKEKERMDKKEEMKNLRKEQKKRRETVKQEKEKKEQISKENIIGGVHFSDDQRRVRATDRVWEKFHHKCIIRVGDSRLYCCNTRRKKWEMDLIEIIEREEQWVFEWGDRFFDLKEKKEKFTKEQIELRINSGAQKLSAAQRATTKKCLDDIIGVVVDRAWVEKEVGDVVYDLADKVALKEAYRLEYSHSENVFHHMEDEKKEEEWNNRELEEGWQQYLDEDSGDYYYENERTGDVQWERPVRPVTPPPMVNLKRLGKLLEKSNDVYAAGVKKYNTSSFLKDGEAAVKKIVPERKELSSSVVGGGR